MILESGNYKGIKTFVGIESNKYKLGLMSTASTPETSPTVSSTSTAVSSPLATKNLLVVMNNFPSQFKTAVNIACLLGWNVYGVCHQEFLVDHYAPTDKIRMIRDIPFDPVQTEPNSINFANAMIHLTELKFVPDLIFVHVGFGIERACRHLFPTIPIVGFCEWYFGENTPLDRGRLVTDMIKNYGIRKQLEDCDFLISPTRIQRAQYPIEYRRRISILHEGIDCDYWKPKADKKPVGADSVRTITYVSRGLEPTRKFMEFVAGAAAVLAERPVGSVQIKIIGKDKVFYSDHKDSFMTIAKTMFSIVAPEAWQKGTVEFLGDVQRAKVLEVMQMSDVHVYFTDLFVPSWSMLEAMACGCLMVVSDNDSCREFVEHEVSGLTVDHSNATAVKNAIVRALNASEGNREILSTNARNVVLTRVAAKRANQQWYDFMTSIV